MGTIMCSRCGNNTFELERVSVNDDYDRQVVVRCSSCKLNVGVADVNSPQSIRQTQLAQNA